MKIEWTIEDIKPGRIVGKFATKEQLMIGWIQAEALNTDHIWFLVSYNADGMVVCKGTKENLVEFLNTTKNIPIELL